MRHSGAESNFEAFRHEKNYRRRQRTNLARPGGSANEVWQELQHVEEGEIHDRLLTQEVHEFFADATRMAAEIVKRVSAAHEQEMAARLRTEVEEFLRSTMQRAAVFIHQMRPGSGEQVIEPDLKRLLGRQLDEFRAQGTAQLEDKHYGQDPFATDVDLDEIHQHQAEHYQAVEEEPLAPQFLHCKDSSLALAAAKVAPPSSPKVPTSSSSHQPVPGPASSAATSPAAAGDAETEQLKEALRTMVRQGLMSKAEAQERWARFRAGR